MGAGVSSFGVVSLVFVQVYTRTHISVKTGWAFSYHAFMNVICSAKFIDYLGGHAM